MNLTILPRTRNVPQRSADGSNGQVYTCPKDKYCNTYFEVFEVALGEVDYVLSRILKNH